MTRTRSMHSEQENKTLWIKHCKGELTRNSLDHYKRINFPADQKNKFLEFSITPVPTGRYILQKSLTRPVDIPGLYRWNVGGHVPTRPHGSGAYAGSMVKFTTERNVSAVNAIRRQRIGWATSNLAWVSELKRIRTGVALGGLKLQSIAIATFSSLVFYAIDALKRPLFVCH